MWKEETYGDEEREFGEGVRKASEGNECLGSGDIKDGR